VTIITKIIRTAR